MDDDVSGLRGGRARGWVVALGGAGALALMVGALRPTPMPGSSFEGPAPPATAEERALAEALERDVVVLAQRIGERNDRRYQALTAARDHVEGRLREAGLSPRRDGYALGGRRYDHVVADVSPIPDGSRPDLLLGAHYDSARGSPGGNDDASGVAVLLALAARLAGAATSIRLVAFVNEEPPHFGTPRMGSRVYARDAAARGELPRRVVVLDSLGCYRSSDGSQRYATFAQELAFGDRGEFVAFVSDERSEVLLRQTLEGFRAVARIPSEGAVLSARSPGAAWSDHASFWSHGVPAILVTDTAAFRDPHYHEPTDDGAQVDFVALARVTLGLEAALRALARAPRAPEDGVAR